MAPTSTGPLTVTLVDESELAVAGLRALMLPYADRVRLVDDREAVARPGAVDVVLFEPDARSATVASMVTSLVQGGARTAVAFCWSVRDDLPVPEGTVCLPKTLAASQLVVALEEVVSGRRTAPRPAPRVAPVPSPAAVVDIAVRQLSVRERDVLVLITGGCSNRDIAAELELSLNSVKTYIRTAYAKIGVERRTQAVLWGLEHGLAQTGREATS